MKEPFAGLVADSLLKVALALETAKRDSQRKLEEARRVPHSPADLAQSVPLPASVERLQGGSYVVTDAAGPPRSYLVFSRQNTQEVFRYRATLNPAADPRQFVEGAYRCVLERPADGAGRDHYTLLLRERHLTPGDFLQAMATSEEFLRRGTALVIVPRNSRWLEALPQRAEDLHIQAP